jgi:hypothetical protein
MVSQLEEARQLSLLLSTHSSVVVVLALTIVVWSLHFYLRGQLHRGIGKYESQHKPYRS